MSENKRVTIPFLEKVLRPIVDLIRTKADKTDILQSDWNQADETQKDFIKNKPEGLAYASDIPAVDHTLSVEGAAADAKAVSDAIGDVSELVGDVAVAAQITEAIASIPQTDWNQNDENAPDYIKNRTHYEATHYLNPAEDLEITVWAHFNTSGTLTGTTDGGMAKISNLTPNATEWTSICTAYTDERESAGTKRTLYVHEATEQGATLGFLNSRNQRAYGSMAIVYAPGYIVPYRYDRTGAPDNEHYAVLNEPGIYLKYTSQNDVSGSLSANHIVWNETVALDEKYIPSTIARTEYVDTKVADLVNTAPEALDTLNELAAALGDDPNFATTVLTQLSNKADKDDIVQSDWDQNNETESDYIKNRPFYYRTKTYELTGISQQLSSSYISLRDLYSIRNTEIDFDDNKSYRVTLDITGSLSEEENNVNTFHCEMTPKVITHTNYRYLYTQNIGTANLNGIEYKYELIIVDASEGGNVRLCLNTTPSGKSQLVTDIKIKIEETKILEEYAIPDTIARTENIPVIDTTLTVSGAAADAKAVEEKILSPKHYITMIDQVSGHTYILSMEDGNLVSKIGIKHISVTTPPNLAEYTHGEYFDPTGMIVTATYYDDTTVNITGYTYPTSFLNSNVQPKITYTEFGITYEAIIPITVNVFDPSTILVDFNYVDNKDGTYTLVGWKGTYNGEPSDKLIIPDYACIII